MRAKKTSTDVRQEQIAVAALELVAERGMKALQVADIARRVGVVPSAIYRHYKSKGDILDTVLQLVGQRLQENVLGVCDETSDALQRLELLLMRHAKLLTTYRAIQSVIFSEEIYGGTSEQRNKAASIVKPYMRAIMRIVSEGQKDGAIRDDLRARTVAVMVMGIIQPAAIIAHLERGRFGLGNHVRQAWPVLRRGIETR